MLFYYVVYLGLKSAKQKFVKQCFLSSQRYEIGPCGTLELT